MKISIIIPIYNVENFLRRTIESLLNQTVQDFEIVLVDDGSTDGSGKICDEYAEKYSNIHVARRVNGGLSAARNTGASAARNEYILFLDADDYLDSDTVEKIETVIEHHAPDCICFGWRYITAEGSQPDAIPNLNKNTLLDQKYIHEVILPPMLNLKKDEEHFIYDFAVNKVYKRSIINEHQIQFDETRRIWEDRPFVVEYLKYCNTFYCMDRACYNYVQTVGSLSSKYYLNFFDIVLANFHNYVKWYGEEYDFDTEYVNTYWCHSIENIVFRSLQQTKDQAQIRENIRKVFADPQVIHWYAMRTPQNDWEKKASLLVGQKRYAELLELYQTQLNKREKQEKRQSRVNILKARLRKLLRR